MKIDKTDMIKALDSDITDEMLNLLTDEEKDFLYNLLTLQDKEKSTYNRMLSRQENYALTTGAYGYLLTLLQMESITAMDLENILNACVNIYNETHSRVDRDRLEKIVTIYMFTGVQNVSSRGYLEMISGQTELTKN